MNIHEHQAKELLKKFGAPVSKGVVIFSLKEIDEKIKELNTKDFVIKAQIHAGGRGKGGGVKIVKNVEVNNIKSQKKSNLLNLTIVFIISFIALVLLVDTFKQPLIKIVPNLEFLLYNLYESIQDIILFIKDLI
jgi:succinyl-CoA synthetase beta subunit